MKLKKPKIRSPTNIFFYRTKLFNAEEVPSGTRGTVMLVDDAGTIHPKWDNGRTLGVIPNVDDFRKLTESEIEAEKMDLQSEENGGMKMNL